MPTNDLDERNFRRALDVIRSRIGIIIACVAVAGGAAFAISSRQQDKYRATASLLLRESHAADDILQTTPTNNDATRQATTNLRLVSAPVVASRTSAALRREGRFPLSTGAVQGIISVEGDTSKSDIIDVI